MFADCGGLQEPRLACEVDEPDCRWFHGSCAPDCRWFSGGCVPEGYRPSACPPGDVCCVENGYSGWPFEDEIGAVAVTEILEAWGLAPVGKRDQLAVDVDIDPAVSVPDAYSCRGTFDSDHEPCDGTLGVERQRFFPRDTLVVLYDGADLRGWTPSVEILPGEGGDPARARVCTHAVGDVRSATCPHHDSELQCAEAGTLTLNRTPDPDDLGGLAGRIEADFGTFTLIGGFRAAPDETGERPGRSASINGE